MKCGINKARRRCLFYDKLIVAGSNTLIQDALDVNGEGSKEVNEARLKVRKYLRSNVRWFKKY